MIKPLATFLILILTTFQLPSFADEDRQIVRAPGTHFAMVKSLNIEDLVSNAEIIFQGKLVGVKNVEENKMLIRKLRFKVTDAIKGIPENKREITLKEWGALRTPFLKDVEEGKKYVFFFHGKSKLGLTSLMGLEQGLVRFDTDDKPVFSRRVSFGHDLNRAISFSLSSATGTLVTNPYSYYIESYQDLKDACQSY